MFFSLAILISAIALLKRKNWARIFFIVVMSLGIIWNISGLAIQFTIFNSLPEVSGESIPASFQNMMLIMKTASVIMAIGLSILFGYIIKKLCSRQIRTEFV
jgi:heme/copper-type cytochrome/quinol oxidase subunit 2